MKGRSREVGESSGADNLPGKADHRRRTTSTASMSQQTMEKGQWYSFNFLLVYFPSVCTGILDPDDAAFFRNLNCMLLPSQGFWNMLTYTAPEWRPWVDRKRKSWFGSAVEKGSSQGQRQCPRSNLPFIDSKGFSLGRYYRKISGHNEN